jgi:hypothetical protein
VIDLWGKQLPCNQFLSDREFFNHSERLYIMRFAFIPKASYKIGQQITVHGKPMIVESYTHTGRNVIVHTPENAPKFQRIVCICTDSKPIQCQ